jgi:hypothetical protein
LGSDGSHQFLDSWAHHVLDLGARDGQVDDRRLLGGGMGDVRCVEHEKVSLKLSLTSLRRSRNRKIDSISKNILEKAAGAPIG